MAPLIQDHYEILGVSPTASFEEIKTAFRQAALRLHPDKLKHAGITVDETQFLKLCQAWDILGNSETRAVYDVQRSAAEARAAVHITDTIVLDDMEYGSTDDGEVIFSCPCRCGGVYAVLEDELTTLQQSRIKEEEERKDGGAQQAGIENNSNTTSEVVVPCSTCSLHILVVLNKPK